ncbi:MAG: hypothetical protein ACYDC1_23360 [Limisphaerales bacterium]
MPPSCCGPLLGHHFLDLLSGHHYSSHEFLRLLGTTKAARLATWAALVQRHGTNAYYVANRHLDRRIYAAFAFQHLSHGERLGLLQPLAAGELPQMTHWPVVWTVLRDWLSLATIPQAEFTEAWPDFLKAWNMVSNHERGLIRDWAEELIASNGAKMAAKRHGGPGVPLCERLGWVEDPNRRTLLAACLGRLVLSWGIDATEDFTRIQHGLGAVFPTGFTLALDFTTPSVAAEQELSQRTSGWGRRGFPQGLKQPPSRVLAVDVFGSASWDCQLGIQITVNLPALEQLAWVSVVEGVALAVMHLFTHAIIRAVPDQQNRLVPRLEAALEDRLVQTVVFRAATRRLQASFRALCAALPANYQLTESERQMTLERIQAYLCDRRVRPGER